MTADGRRSVWVAFGQVALVLLSVGLGLGIGEWRQGKADTVRAQQAMDAVVREIATNRERVAAAFAYHADVIDSLQTGGDNRLELRSAFVVDNAWETAQAAGVVPDLPFPVVERLARLHETQTTYQDLARMNLGLLYFGNVFSSDRLPSDLRGYIPNMHDLRHVEGDLLDLYADALESLDAAGFAVADSLLAR